jgi:hypothetical protein
MKSFISIERNIKHYKISPEKYSFHLIIVLNLYAKKLTLNNNSSFRWINSKINKLKIGTFNLLKILKSLFSFNKLLVLEILIFKKLLKKDPFILIILSGIIHMILYYKCHNI